MLTAAKLSIARRFPALVSRDYSLFLVGQLVSVIGTWMQSTALPYLAYRISGRPLDLGIIGFASTVPTLLFALPAGVLVERWNKRKVVIIFQAVMAVQAFGLALLAYNGQIKMWQIVLLAFVYGSAVAVEVTARQAMLVELAGKDALPSAIALQSTAFNVGRVLGPLCAAWIIAATSHEANVFLANGISYLFVIAGLFLAQTRYRVEYEPSSARNMRAEFKEGLAYIRSNLGVLSVILMAALVGFFGIPMIQQIPALARDVLGTLADTEALVAARTSNLYAAQGVGALVASFMTIAMVTANQKRMLLLGQIVFIVPLIALGFTRNNVVALILVTFIGWGIVAQLVNMNTLIQTEVPDRLRGRVFSVYFWGLQGVAPFGSILIGGIAQTWNVPAAAITGGIVCLLGITIIRLTLRNAGRTSA
jgi:MFS family permease